MNTNHHNEPIIKERTVKELIEMLDRTEFPDIDLSTCTCTDYDVPGNDEIGITSRDDNCPVHGRNQQSFNDQQGPDRPTISP